MIGLPFAVPSVALKFAPIAVLVVLLGVQSYRVASLKSDLAETRAIASESLSKAIAETMAKERMMAEKTKQKELEYLHEKSKTESSASVIGRNSSILRDASSRRASVPTAAAICASGTDSAATAWGLFGEAQDFAGEMAKAAEQHADEVRFLKGLYMDESL